MRLFGYSRKQKFTQNVRKGDQIVPTDVWMYPEEWQNELTVERNAIASRTEIVLGQIAAHLSRITGTAPISPEGSAPPDPGVE